MLTLLWIVLGGLLGLVAWLTPDFLIVLLVLAGLAVLAALVPASVLAIPAKVALGAAGLYLVLFLPIVVRDPGAASGSTYLVVGLSLVTLVAAIVGILRARARAQARAKIKAGEQA